MSPVIGRISPQHSSGDADWHLCARFGVIDRMSGVAIDFSKTLNNSW